MHNNKDWEGGLFWEWGCEAQAKHGIPSPMNSQNSPLQDLIYWQGQRVSDVLFQK